MLLPPDLIDQITNARAQKPKLRERDLAAAIGLSEAHLLAAEHGTTTVRIAADPQAVLPHVCGLGEVMALTRNDSAVHERRGVYLDYRAGDHAQMVLGPEIDLRIFPRHWVHAFAVMRQTDAGVRRSLQVFDAAGDAVHKVHLEPTSDIAAFDRAVDALRLPDAAPFDLTAREAPEGPLTNPDRTDDLRQTWARMTDTHQFLMLTRKLRMNRLGAYHAVGAGWADRLAPDAVSAVLERAAEAQTNLMIFVGNPGCIQIHSGPVHRVESMGPWQNVLDPRFNLHLRTDHIAEAWLVRKPTKRGDALSVEAFDKAGQLILQIFGKRAEQATQTGDWDALASSLLPEGVA